MLNAICALSLAAASAVGGLSASFQKDRKDAIYVDDAIGVMNLYEANLETDVALSVTMPVYVSSRNYDESEVWAYSEYLNLYVNGDSTLFYGYLFFHVSGTISEFNWYLDGVGLEADDYYSHTIESNGYGYCVNLVLSSAQYESYIADGYVNVLALNPTYSYADYIESTKIVPSITSGLGVVSNLAQGLVGGFDAMALDDGAMTSVMTFAFTLLGIGCAVGVSKKVFNWITGRHGM